MSIIDIPDSLNRPLWHYALSQRGDLVPLGRGTLDPRLVSGLNIYKYDFPCSVNLSRKWTSLKIASSQHQTPIRIHPRTDPFEISIPARTHKHVSIRYSVSYCRPSSETKFPRPFRRVLVLEYWHVHVWIFIAGISNGQTIWIYDPPNVRNDVGRLRYHCYCATLLNASRTIVHTIVLRTLCNGRRR